MLFAEPGLSPYDVRFRIFSIPVRIHPIFWLVAVVLGLNAGSMLKVSIWVAAVFLAILLHELGHALVMRYFGLRPWIVLHGMGGVACYDSGQLSYSQANTWQRQVFISAAGAAAGFFFAILLVSIFLVLGHSVWVVAGVNTSKISIFGLSGIRFLDSPDLAYTGLFVQIVGIKSLILSELVNDLLQICILWGLLNLLPVYPLDGGHIAREILLRFNARSGIRNSLILSTATAGFLALFYLGLIFVDRRNAMENGGSDGSGFNGASLFVPMLFGYLAYSSYAMLQAFTGRRSQW